jgi:hypothetical protein
MTPEEEERIAAKFRVADMEEEAPEDDEGLSGPCDCGEGAVHYTDAECPFEQRRKAADELTRLGQEMEPPPPQPERRPPYAVAYSVQGHLYEVAVSGDASVKAVDGALVIQHHLGPVAGICQVLPVINEESNG